MYSIGEFSNLIGVSTKTLERWDKTKKLIASRTPTGRRYYTEEQYSVYKNVPTLKGVNEVYLRAVCSRHGTVTQEQIDSLKVFCARKLGIQVELIIFPKK